MTLHLLITFLIKGHKTFNYGYVIEENCLVAILEINHQREQFPLFTPLELKEYACFSIQEKTLFSSLNVVSHGIVLCVGCFNAKNTKL